MSVVNLRRYSFKTGLVKGNEFADIPGASGAWVPPGSPTIYIDPNNPSSYPGTGTTVYDLSGNGNNGTLVNGPTYTAGTPSYFTYDGSNDYLTYGSAGAPFGNISYAFWVYYNSVSGTKTPFAKWSDTGNQRSILHVQDSVYPVWYVDKSGNFGNQRNITGTPISATTWYLIGFSFSNTTGNLRAFINNSLQTTTTFGTSGDPFASTSALENARQGEPSRYMAGRIGEVFVYNSTLSDADLTDIWTNTKTKYGY